jgi:hypothetical protein
MNLPSLQQDFPQVRNAPLCQKHLILGSYHGSSSSTIPRFWKLLVIWYVSSHYLSEPISQ